MRQLNTQDKPQIFNNSLFALQALRDHALEKATKYRWDPWLSEAHEEYLNQLNNILKECT